MDNMWNDSFQNYTFDKSSDIYQNETLRFYNYATAVYNIMLLTTGCIGNIIVLIVYGVRFKPSPFNTFIVFLAAMDLICCAIEMPLDATNMAYHKMIYGCKAIVGIATTTANATGYTLVAIAALRYRGICHPLKQNISIKHARIIVFVALLLALCVSWPSYVLTTDQIVFLTPETNESVYFVVNCAAEDIFVDTIYPVIYNLILSTIFVSALLAMVILYVLIARRMWLRKKYGIGVKTNKTKASQSTSSTSSQNMSLMTTRTPGSESIGSNYTNKAKSSRQHANCQKPRNQGMLKMLFLVTLFFILSYVPHLTLMVYQFIAGKLKLTRITESIVGIIIRSYLINSTCNPIIYGCNSKKFRQEIKKIFSKK